MILRAILSRPRQHRDAATWVSGLALTLAIACGLTSPSFATVQSIEVAPASPTACDSVALVVKGVVPIGCHTVIRASLGDLKLLPTMGPVPSYEIGVRIVVQEPDPSWDVTCPAPLEPYERTFHLPYHPFGSYLARATEYLVLYSPVGPTTTPIDTSRVSTTFQVAPDSCQTPGCYFLGFNSPGLPDGFCDAAGAPGGIACVDIVLGGMDYVAGFQSVIRIHDPRLDQTLPLPGSIIRPISVKAIGDAKDFQVNWTADESTVRFLLYSTEGKVLPRGQKTVLRVCYAIGAEAVPGPYLLRFGATVVSDPKGQAIPPCPTLTEEVGRLCVSEGGCDLDGNGRSNVLDIIRLVRCALGGTDSTAVCPDSIAARADCNEDGTVDIRDVICCVRNIIKLRRLGATTSPTIVPSTDATRVRFVGPAEYWKPGYGRVLVEVDPGSDFGGTNVEIEAATGTRIYGVSDEAVTPSSRYMFVSDVGDGQSARFMIVRGLANDEIAEPIRAWVFFQAVDAVQRDAAFRIVDAEGGSWSQAAAAPAEVTQGTATIQPNGSPAPRVHRATPNPFTSATDIQFELSAMQHLTVRIYSATGKLVRTLVDTTMPVGLNRVSWNGKDSSGREVSSGIYFVKFSVPEAESTIRIMRLR